MIQGLSVFARAPKDCLRDPKILRSGVIKSVVCCALGPKGNNIEQAATLWLSNNCIADKGEVILRETPERCLELARWYSEFGVVAVFWTCAVYRHENIFFFRNPDVFPFFYAQEMLLDEEQLATKPANEDKIRVNGGIPREWRIASHPSPAPMVDGYGPVQLCNSNAASAKACADGETELCITTESARQIYGLVKVHSFGSPNMVFFGGITQHGLAQIKKAQEEWTAFK